MKRYGILMYDDQNFEFKFFRVKNHFKSNIFWPSLGD